MEGVRENAEGAEVESRIAADAPTRYPGWRTIGYLLGLLHALSVYGATLLYFRTPTSLRAVGWVTHDPPATELQYRTFLLFGALAAGGALLSAWRPARGSS